VSEYLPYLFAGLRLTVLLAVISIVLGLGIGLIVAMARMSRFGLVRAAAGLYVDLWRSTPFLAQILWVFFALPILTGITLSAFEAGILTLSCNVSASLAEIFRAGILSLPVGQRDAGLALGMTRRQVLRRVVLPQAIGRVLPPIGSAFISLCKDTALVSVINLQELMWHAQTLAGLTLRSIEALTAAGILYALLTYPLTLFVNHLHRRHLAHG
jgi:polar amino acid transport system permease protein